MDSENVKKSFGRGKNLLLAASLLVNLLVAGVVIGEILEDRHHDRGSKGRDERSLSFGPYTRALSDADQRMIWSDLRERQGPPRSHFRQLRAQVEEIAQLIRQTPYDAGAVEQIFERQRQLLDGKTMAVREVLLDHIAGMSDAERVTYADRLQEALHHRRKRCD